MLGIPSTTPYDLRFQLFGIPIRVHPFFWLVALLLSGSNFEDFRVPAIWVACVFVSVIVHEMGHGLTARGLGYSASIVLFGMGGLCFSEGERQTPRQRLAVLFMGPGAGFLLFGLLLGALYLVYRITPQEGLALAQMPGFSQHWVSGLMKLSGTSLWLRLAIANLLFINLMWGLLNLLPVYPLDGGQITRVLLGQLNRRNGVRWSHVLSLLTAGALAALAYLKLNSIYMALLFGMFALSNYQILQEMHQLSRHGVFDDDTDWWKR